MGMEAGHAAPLQLAHRYQSRGQCHILPADMPQVKAVWAVPETHINPLPFVQGAYLLCTVTIMNTENCSLLNMAC